MTVLQHQSGIVGVAKASKATKRVLQHTWRVTRRNNQSVEITAENLSVTFGDLVFSSKGVVVRVIGVDTYNDVELVSGLEC
jgi:acetate kinase